MTSGNTRVCLVRYHDGTAKSNWGGRATSLALGKIISEHGVLASVVNGSVLTRRFINPGLDDQMRRLKRRASRVVSRAARGPQRGSLEFTAKDFARVELDAQGRLSQLPEVERAFQKADEIWVNGEGDMILSPRPSLYRMLVVMHLAKAMGKQVRMVNALLSRPVGLEPVDEVTDAVGRALASCTSVVYRDPESLRLHQHLFSSDASWAPDALFAWAKPRQDPDWFGPVGEGLAPELQAALLNGEPYVVVSGSSAISRSADREQATRDLRVLIRELRGRGLEPVVVATCDGDEWMLTASSETHVVRSTIPLATGQTLLSFAECFISGRYHPSILAADSGTPSVLMTSNSHKTRSLQEILGKAPIEFPFFGEGFDATAVADEALRSSSGDRQALLRTAQSLGERVRYV